MSSTACFSETADIYTGLFADAKLKRLLDLYMNETDSLYAPLVYEKGNRFPDFLSPWYEEAIYWAAPREKSSQLYCGLVVVRCTAQLCLVNSGLIIIIYLFYMV